MSVQDSMSQNSESIIDLSNEPTPGTTGALVQQPPDSMEPAPQSTELDRMVAYDAEKKSMAMAYVIWWLVGIFGGHRFYFGKTGSATAMLCISLLSLPLMAIFVGFLTIGITFVWAFVDLFLIPGWTREHNQAVARSLGVRPVR